MELELPADNIFYSLFAAYALISSIALIQLVRIHLRTPDIGWTKQKLFHFMVFIFSGVRADVLLFQMQGFVLNNKVIMMAMMDLPVILFFTTFTLLILFWAEIYYQANLRNHYIALNVGVYAIQLSILTYQWLNGNLVSKTIGKIFFSVLSLMAAVGFVLYGRKLLHELKKFPPQSEQRNRKLSEVRSVAIICSTCFFIRSFLEALSIIEASKTRAAFNHPVFNLVTYMLMEILPTSLVLFILRQLPPKRASTQYQRRE